MKLVMEVMGESVYKQPWELEESHKKFLLNIISLLFPKSLWGQCFEKLFGKNSVHFWPLKNEWPSGQQPAGNESHCNKGAVIACTSSPRVMTSQPVFLCCRGIQGDNKVGPSHDSWGCLVKNSHYMSGCGCWWNVLYPHCSCDHGSLYMC